VERAQGIALGTSFGCAMVESGNVRCWGNEPRVVPGSNRIGDAPRTAQAIAALTGVARIASSFDHVCAVRLDGSLWCWGNNSSVNLASAPRSGGVRAASVRWRNG
jgi:alpha-tubulin suppressor-like RCC1 family protein